MRCIAFSSPAFDDIQHVWQYIAVENSNPDAAESLIWSLHDAVDSLRGFSFRGQRCHEIEECARDIRRLGVRGFSIYYHVTETAVRIIRIIHDRHDREQALSQWASDLL